MAVFLDLWRMHVNERRRAFARCVREDASLHVGQAAPLHTGVSEPSPKHVRLSHIPAVFPSALSTASPFTFRDLNPCPGLGMIRMDGLRLCV